MNREQAFKAALIGLAVGDALGVPVEFVGRTHLKRRPITGVTGHGMHNQPAGTWSDDTSLTMCLAEALCDGYSLDAIGQSFAAWLLKGHWTARGTVFDVGLTTREAIFRLDTGSPPTAAGGRTVHSNGNGSLMRILPMALAFSDLNAAERVKRTRDVSCLTHAHPRSQLACVIYVETAVGLLAGCTIVEALKNMTVELMDRLSDIPELAAEQAHFTRILEGDLQATKERDISSDGYVVHTLEASLWCLLNSNSFVSAVLKAVNLGGDSDTTGAVTGGLAGLRYGLGSIPIEWIPLLARAADIMQVATVLAKHCRVSDMETDDAKRI